MSAAHTPDRNGTGFARGTRLVEQTALTDAAPDLLAALQRMVSVYGKDVDGGASEQARIAIAKAVQP